MVVPAVDESLELLRKKHYNATVSHFQVMENADGAYILIKVVPDDYKPHNPAQHNILGFLKQEERPEGFPEPVVELKNSDLVMRQYTISDQILLDNILGLIAGDLTAGELIRTISSFKETREAGHFDPSDAAYLSLVAKAMENKAFLAPQNQGVLEYYIAVEKKGQLTPRLFMNLKEGSRIHATAIYKGDMCPLTLEDIPAGVNTIMLASTGAGLPGTNPLVNHLISSGYLDNPQNRIINLLTTRRKEDLGIYHETHLLLSQLFPNYEVIINETRGAEKMYPQAWISTGRLEQAFGFTFGPNTAAYMCGSKNFAGLPDNAERKAAAELSAVPKGSETGLYRALLDKGVPHTNIKGEAW